MLRKDSFIDPYTGWFGLGGYLLAWGLLQFHAGPSSWLLLGLAAPMMSWSLWRGYAQGRFHYRALGAHTGFKLVGHTTALLALAGCYWLFPEYRQATYVPFFRQLMHASTWLFLGWLLLQILDDLWCYQEQEPARLLGAWLCQRGPKPSGYLVGQHYLGWLVKGYFLPLMFAAFYANAQHLQLPTGGFIPWFRFGLNFLYTLDVAYVALGYSVTSSLLNSHLRSVEPTLLGWGSAVLCYAPFWGLLTVGYFSYWREDVWLTVATNQPELQLVWGTAILAVVAVYAWASLSFGLCFSNLTHRGIVQHGPYAWVRHPAYWAKVTGYFLITVPCYRETWQAALRDTSIWLLVVGIYYVRARTEEQHLSSKGPEYAAYRQGVKARWQHWWARMAQQT